MEDWAFEVSEDLDCTQELVEVVGQARLRVPFLGVWKEVDLRLLPLRLGGQARVHVQEAVAHEPADRGHYSQEDEQTIAGASAANQWRVGMHSQGGKVHGEGQAHGEQCKEPCWEGNSCEGNQPKEEARDDTKDEEHGSGERSEHSCDAISAAVWQALDCLVGGCGRARAHDRRKAAGDGICQGVQSIRPRRRIHGGGPARDNASYMRGLISIVSYCSGG